MSGELRPCTWCKDVETQRMPEPSIAIQSCGFCGRVLHASRCGSRTPGPATAQLLELAEAVPLRERMPLDLKIALADFIAEWSARDNAPADRGGEEAIPRPPIA